VSALQAGEFTRGGLRVRRWPRLEEGEIALELPDGSAHLIVPEAIADQIKFVPNPFAGSQ
jgi:hypothetical protein